MSKDVILRPSYWASVSGGKDSLYMLSLILHNLDRYPLHGVVHFELEIDYPFIKDVIDYMESECKKYGIPFVRIKPKVSWYELYEKYGFPVKFLRWCNSEYKMDAKRQLKAFLKERGGRLISYIGYCYDEVERYSDRNNDDEIYPLVENKIIESDILEWAKSVPIFNNYYKFNKRCGCMFCPLMSMNEFAYMLAFYPEKYAECINLAKDTEQKMLSKLGRPFAVFSSNPKYNAEYRDNRVRTAYLPKLLEKIEEMKGKEKQ